MAHLPTTFNWWAFRSDILFFHLHVQTCDDFCRAIIDSAKSYQLVINRETMSQQPKSTATVLFGKNEEVMNGGFSFEISGGQRFNAFQVGGTYLWAFSIQKKVSDYF